MEEKIPVISEEPIPEEEKEEVPQINLTYDDWLLICSALEDYHTIFCKVWSMGRPIFTTEIPTAAVVFDELGGFFSFKFNPYFWLKLDFQSRIFCICHEALHVILNHGIRTRDAGNKIACNYALDVVVNHLLVEQFGFNRYGLYEEQEMCWVDTVFKDADEMPKTDEQFEYYFNLFDKTWAQAMPINCHPLDDHSGLDSTTGNKILKKIFDGLSPEEIQSIKGVISNYYSKAGNEEGGWEIIDVPTVKKKKKWETVIKRWSKKYYNPGLKIEETWSRINRRLSLMPEEFFIPTDYEIEDDYFEKKKIPIWFFLDTSGSCWDMKERFFSAASSLPPERFDVRLFCFDTVVHETTLSSKKIYGRGGTSFSILEHRIQREMLSGSSYPEAVFVMTDGYGTHVTPLHPDRWFWFLMEGGSTMYIPKKSTVHRLHDFE